MLQSSFSCNLLDRCTHYHLALLDAKDLFARRLGDPELQSYSVLTCL